MKKSVKRIILSSIFVLGIGSMVYFGKAAYYKYSPNMAIFITIMIVSIFSFLIIAGLKIKNK